VSVSVVIERVHAKHARRHLLVDSRREERTLGIVGHHLDSSNDAERVLLIPDFFQPQLLRVGDAFQNCRIGPLEIVAIVLIRVGFEQREFSD